MTGNASLDDLIRITPLMEIYYDLLAAQGHQHWWPAETRFEVLVGTILAQNTSWRNAKQAIAAIKANNLLGPSELLALPETTLAELIRPARYPRVKADRLRSLLTYFIEVHGGDPAQMAREDTSDLRRQLLAVKGVGPETADSILLYALDKPIFVVDAYTRRITSRVGLITSEAGYSEVQELFESQLPHDVALYNDYHAQLVRLGNEKCRPRPRCNECPIQSRCDFGSSSRGYSPPDHSRYAVVGGA